MTDQEVKELVAVKVQAEMKKIRRMKLVFWSVGILLIPIAVWAAAITKPHTFNDGDTLSANKLNENFDTVYAKTNSIDTKVEKRLGAYCGKTSSSFSGSGIGGYTGAKTKCQTACSNNNAHLCSTHEIIISIQENIAVDANVTFFGGIYGANQISQIMNDCQGWTSASSTQRHQSWDGAIVVDNLCSNPLPLACCL